MVLLSQDRDERFFQFNGYCIHSGTKIRLSTRLFKGTVEVKFGDPVRFEQGANGGQLPFLFCDEQDSQCADDGQSQVNGQFSRWQVIGFSTSQTGSGETAVNSRATADGTRLAQADQDG
jgi:hypothetical protein